VYLPQDGCVVEVQCNDMLGVAIVVRSASVRSAHQHNSSTSNSSSPNPNPNPGWLPLLLCRVEPFLSEKALATQYSTDDEDAPCGSAGHGSWHRGACAGYGARFRTGFCTRGCHWIPRLFA
jgi:hypothetical protein